MPFRGGIAQHTTMLARAIGSEQDCRILSFKRLYPSFLYPGESDRDSDSTNHREPFTDYVLDSLNPLNWHSCFVRITKIDPAFVLIPWWTFFLGPCYAYLATVLRRKNVEVVFLCHNVSDHEDRVWKRLIAKWVLKRGSRFVVHTNLDAKRLLELVPHANVAVHPHPTYDQFPDSTNSLPRRAKVELLFYGFVRPYKGLDVLIEALGLMRDESVFLTVAGEFWEGLTDTRMLADSLGVSHKLEILPKYHSDSESADLFARADAVILPYLSATGSGVIPLAYRYGRPVIASRVGGIPDVVIDGETGWLIDSGDPGALAGAIRNLWLSVPEEMARSIERFNRRLTWQSLCRTVVDINREAGAA